MCFGVSGTSGKYRKAIVEARKVYIEKIVPKLREQHNKNNKTMKNKYGIILGTFILSLTFSCKQQIGKDQLYKYDDNGKLNYLISGSDTINADRIYFYPTGEFKGFQKYKKGKRHGESSLFYLSGRRKDHWIWYEGHPDGPCYNYGDTYRGYPMEFLLYGGDGQLVCRMKYDSIGKLYSTEGGVPKDWDK